MVVYALPGIFVMGYLVCLMESYVIRCPEQSEWNIRAGIQCQNITDYFCLYNYIYYTFEEGCTGPEWDIPGRKRVYSGNFNTAPCRDTRYQPIIFLTNGNSDCIFRKSLCTEKGQTLFTNGTTRTDSTCRCDYTQGYAYVTIPRNKCYCRPSEEDCSCYLKKCKGVGYNLSADYECTNDITKKTDCPFMSANASEDPHIDMVPPGTPRADDLYVIRRKCDVFCVVLLCTFGMIVITTCFMLFETLLRCPHQSTEEAVEVHIESGRMDAGPLLKIIDHNATNDQSADNAESKRMETGPSLDTIEQNASNDESVFTICVMFHQRLARCLQQFTKKAWKDGIGRIETDPSLNTTYQNATNDQPAVEVHIESGMIDAGPSLNTTEQNATNDQAAIEVHIESGRMDAGPLLKITDHNATNDQSADNAESKRMDTGPSLDTIGQNASNDESVLAGKAGSEMTNTCPSLDTNEQNASNNESAGTAESERIDTGQSLNTLEQTASNDESDDEDQIGLGELDENQNSVVDELTGSIEKEGLDAAFTHFNETIDNWRNEPVKLALTGKSGLEIKKGTDDTVTI